MTDIFISYARPTEAAAQTAARLLRKLGYEVWLDDQLPAHRAYGDVIEERLVAARAVLVIWSGEAVRSEWVRSEANRARMARKLVQMTLEDVEPPMPFDMIECAKLPGWKGDPQAPGWIKVTQSIAALIESPTIAPPKSAEARLGAAGRRGRGGPRMWVICAVGLATILGIGALAWWLWGGGAARGLPPEQNGRIAIAGFAANQDPVLEKLGERITQSLVSILADNGVAMSVQAGPADQAGGPAELQVKGTLQRMGEVANLDAQVLDRRTGYVLWTDRFTTPVDRPAPEGEDPASEIAATLHCALEDRRIANVATSVTTLSLAINICATIFTDKPDLRMLTLARRLASIAPDYAPGHALHAIAAGFAVTSGETGDAMRESLRREAREAAERALRINPRMAKAYLGLEMVEAPRDWKAREGDTVKALSIDPDLPPAQIAQEHVLRSLGRLREALDIDIEMGASGDPRAQGRLLQLAVLQAAVGDVDGSRSILQRMDTSNPGSSAATRFLIDFWWGDPATARVALKGLRADAFDSNYADCFARILDDRLSGRRPGPGLPAACADVQPDFRIRMMVGRGDLDGAYALADQLFQTPGGDMPLFLYYPDMKPFRADPRFMPLAKRLGLLDYWRTTGQWPDFCKAPDRPYDCARVARGV